MATGLIALLDDVAAIAKLAAASLDDVGAAAGRASAKAAGVVVDDTAVTPRYVSGLSPARELPIIGKIALGSLRNKLLILLPAALLLSAFAPWAITPLLMLGGAYLSFEGAEKLAELFGLVAHEHEDGDNPQSAADMEKTRVKGAIRTDLILSAEIMAIALADVANQTILSQGVILAVVAVAITILVYGFVALLVKMDDMGVALWKRSETPSVRAFARALVRSMPRIMNGISRIGIAAMLWVGGGILVHGLEHFGLNRIPHAIHTAAAMAAEAVPVAHGVVEWLVTAIGSALVGLALGMAILIILRLFRRH